MINERRLAEILVEMPTGEKEFERALARLQEAPLTQLAPTAIWVLLGLARHVDRQRWVGEVVTSMGADISEIGRIGAFGHPEHLEQRGRVPVHDGWTYFFHGRGCCLSHQDGTEIDVDFINGRCETIDDFFYAGFLRSVAEPGLVEERLRRPEPLERFWMAYLSELKSAGLIDDTHHIRLTSDGIATAAALETLLAELEGNNPAWKRSYLAAALGDLELARKALTNEGLEVPPTLEDWAGEHRQLRARHLSDRLYRADAFETGFILVALAELGRDVAENRVLEALRRDPPDGAVSRALGLLAAWDDPKHQDYFVELLGRCPGDDIPQPYLRRRALEYLMGKYSPETLPTITRAAITASLEADQRSSEGAAAFILYLIDPRTGLQRLSLALEHDVPMARAESAAALALIGTREAFEVVAKANSSEAKVALAVLEGREVEPGPPPEGELIDFEGRPVKVYSMDEIMRSERPSWTLEMIRELRKRWFPLLERWRPR